jgi:OHCU decarboxylase
MTLEEFNALPRYRAEGELLKCCGSTGWVRIMAGRRPFANSERLLRAADEVWQNLEEADWREAFGAHPQIGQRVENGWAAQEQSCMRVATLPVTTALEEANREYLAKFGFIFVVCASGKTGDELLAILRERLPNDPEPEIRLAAEEQRKITRLRLGKLFTE